jgi:putative glycosyltransferase (TIGR04372 family)
MISEIYSKLSNPYANRNDLNVLLKNFLRFINVFINIIFFIIFKIFNLKLLDSPTEAIGHQIVDIECFFAEKKKNFKIVILENKLANKFLFKNFQINNKKNFFLIKNNFICNLLFYQKKFKNISYSTAKYLTKHYAYGFDKINSIKFSYKLKQEHILFAENILKKKNILINKPLVIIHARDSSYKPYDDESYRNSDINSYESSVFWLLKKGYQVIRLGNKGMKECKYKNKIIDLVDVNFGKHKELIDLYFVHKSKFFIGSCSGLNLLPVIFNKPALSVNMAPFCHVFPFGRKSIGIPKLLINTNNKKKINFRDILDYDFCASRTNTQLKKLNLKYVDNSADEILKATKELEMKFKKNKFIESKIQKNFRKIFNKKHHYSAESQGVVSYFFLKKYKNLF